MTVIAEATPVAETRLPTPERGREWLRQMVLIRRFEERADKDSGTG